METGATILHSAHIRAMDTAGTIAEAIAWRNGRLIAIGRRAEVEAVAGPGARSIDLGGAAVLPGFVDAHHHPSILALYGGVLRLEPPRVTDIPSLQRALAEASKTLEAGQWLVATQWDDARLAEGRAPTRAELDEAVPDRPLMALHYTCHRLAANSRALAEAGIDRHTPDPSGGEISRGRDQEPNGILIERGMNRVEKLARASLVARDAEGFLARLAAHMRAMAAVGITRVVDATVPPDLALLYREARARGALIVPTVMMPVSVEGYLEAPHDALDGPSTGQLEDPLIVGPLKLVFDGAPGCAMCLGWWQVAGMVMRTWALSVTQGSLAPVRTAMSVSPRLGASIRTGILIYRREEAREIIAAAVERGFALATHAIGNEAVDIALSAYEAQGASLGRAGPPRLEHATFLDHALVDRIARVGAIVVAQPHFMSLPEFDHAASIPGLPNSPLRWLLDAGVKVAGSSDHPVAGFDPLDGIRSALSRRTRSGRVYETEQRVTLDEALTMYTRTAAEASGALDRTGTLEVGKRADIVVLDGPLKAERDIEAARVRATIIGGEIVYGALEGRRVSSAP